MKSSTAIWLLLCALVLGFLAYTLNRTPASPPPPGLEDWNTPLLKGVDLSGLDAITLSNAGHTVTLALSNKAWQVAERFGYPADTAKLRGLMDSLRNAVLVEAIDVDTPHLADLGLAEGQGVRLRLEGPGGKGLFVLKAGGMRMKKPDGAAASFYGGYPDGRYVQTDRGVFLLSDSLDALDDDGPLWLDKEFLRAPGALLSTLVVEGPGRTPVRLTRVPNQETWMLDGQAAGKTNDSARISRLADALSYFSFEDVADPALPDTVTGCATGVTVLATATNGVAYHIRVGNRDAGQSRRYVTLAVTGPDPLPEPAARLAARVAPWVYLVEDSQAEPLLFTFEQLTAIPPPETESASMP